jgi:hypothetical protein
MIESLKRQLKKSHAIHSAYKLARDFGQIPKRKLTRFEALQDIAKILPNTMLKMPRLFDLFDLVKQINEDMTLGASSNAAYGTAEQWDCWDWQLPRLAPIDAAPFQAIDEA